MPAEHGTQNQLQQVMNHREAGVYQAYIDQNVQIDVQAAFIGKPSAHAAMKAVSHMSLHLDPRAPKDADTPALDAVRTDPELIALLESRDRLSQEVRDESGSIKRAQELGTKLFQLYDTTSKEFRHKKKKMLDLARRDTRDRFFDTISTVEINKQLNPLFVDLEEGWEPPAIEHRLAERQRVAQLICQPAVQVKDPLQHRIETGNALRTGG